MEPEDDSMKALLRYTYTDLFRFARECYNSGLFCDIALHCDDSAGSPVLCHGLILSSVLPHFGDLADVLRNTDEPVLNVSMPDFRGDVVRRWIGRLYDCLVEGGETLEIDVPPGFAGAFGLFTPALLKANDTSVVFKNEIDDDDYVPGADHFLKREFDCHDSSDSDDREGFYNKDDVVLPTPKLKKKRRSMSPMLSTPPKKLKSSKASQSKQRQNHNAPRFVKEPPYEENSSSQEDDVELGAAAETVLTDRRKSSLPTYDKAKVRTLFKEGATLQRVLFRYQAAGTIPDMYERAYFVSIGAIVYENLRGVVRFRPITTSDSTMEQNSVEFDEFVQVLRICYGLSTSDIFFQPYSPYRKLLYLPWRDQLRDAARRIKSVYGDDKDLIEAAKEEHRKEMQGILTDMLQMPKRPKYNAGYRREKTVILDCSMPLSESVGLGIIVWKPKGVDKTKYECICSPFPEGALISKLLKSIFHFWFGDSKSTPHIPNWLRDKFVPVFDLHSTQAALSDPFRQCEKCGELIEFTDYQVHLERHTLAQKQCCGLSFKSEGEMKAHIRVFHANDNVRNKAVMCPHCKRSFAEKNIEKHWAVCYEREQEFVCPDCGKSYSNRGKMNAHYICSHKLFSCPKCGEGFQGRVKFRQHKVDVHAVRLPCTHCGKTFAGESRLNDHVSSIHTPDEEKPHRCVLCGRGFGRMDKLQAHIKVVHDNIKDVVCRHGCGARFSCSGNRNLHEKKKHLSG